MKKITLIIGILFLSTSLVFQSCKKSDTEPVPVNNTPSLTFMTGGQYVSSNTTLEVNTVFTVGVLGSKNTNTNVDIATFKVVRSFEGVNTTVYENNAVDNPNLSWESNEVTIDDTGNETWTFTIMDYSGKIKELSFIITTTPDMTPLLSFLQGGNYVTGDIILNASSPFQVGVNCQQNPSSSSKLASFSVVKTFENATWITVFDTSNINASTFLWEIIANTNAAPGQETWVFSLKDEAGETQELSFIITTTLPAYNPAFSPTYLIDNSTGVDLLEFFLTCTTDDWETIKFIVTYPEGLGTDEFIGGGQLYTQGSPFIFPVLFPNLSGIWTFSITGIIKSGAHIGENFTVITTIVVSG